MPRGVVLDLRGNRGGLLGQAVAVASAFLAEGVVAQTGGRHPDAARTYVSAGPDLARGVPLVVLVDGRTASAAEIVAAALSDRGRGVVVGSATTGKGLIQAVVPLPNGGELLVTWSRVLAPRGWPIQGLGVLPAVCTSLGAEATAAALARLRQGEPPMARGPGAAAGGPRPGAGQRGDGAPQHLPAGRGAPGRPRRARTLIDSRMPMRGAGSADGVDPGRPRALSLDAGALGATVRALRQPGRPNTRRLRHGQVEHHPDQARLAAPRPASST